MQPQVVIEEKIGEIINLLRLRRNGEKSYLILGIIRDITVKKQLENQVMEAENKSGLFEGQGTTFFISLPLRT